MLSGASLGVTLMGGPIVVRIPPPSSQPRVLAELGLASPDFRDTQVAQPLAFYYPADERLVVERCRPLVSHCANVQRVVVVLPTRPSPHMKSTATSAVPRTSSER